MLASVVGLVGRRGLFLSLLLAACMVATVAAFQFDLVKPNANLPGRVLVFSFAFGCMVHAFRDRIPCSAPLFVAALVAAAAMFTIPALAFAASIPVAYATVYAGLRRWPRIPFGDLSYGIYLFHFSVARTVDELGAGRLGTVALVVVTTIVTGGFAALSWTFVEKPVLARKARVLAAVAAFEASVARIRRRGRRVGSAAVSEG